MKVTQRKRDQLLECGLVLLAILGLVAPASAGSQATSLSPEAGEGRVATTIVGALEHQHYRKLRVDDAFSESVLGRYLEALDPSHASLLSEDVAEFERLYGRQLDDALTAGDVSPAFAIFQRFRTRLAAQLDDYRAALAAGVGELRFDVPETVEFDRSKAPWPRSEDEAREIWRKRFKHQVLSLRLDGQADEEIQTTLARRYENQDQRLAQSQSRDVFNVFMNVVTQTFDPHTDYFPPQEAENFGMRMALSFQGIGAELTTDGEFATVARLIPGGPAEKSGLVQATDRIVAVGQGSDGELVDVIGMRLDEVVALIRGPAGSHVRLALRSAEAVDGSRLIDLERDEVQLEEQAARSETVEVQAEGRPWKVGVIELPTFYVDFEAAQAGEPDYRSSTRDVARLIGELKAAGVDGIVMDLRGNGGGSLNEAESMSALFLGPGPVVQVRDAAGRVQVLGSHEHSIYDGPLVVLIDRLSASASEIFAAAIQDRGRGLIVGSATFGKGTVQAVLPLEEGQLKLTQAKFYRVSGGSTQHRGVSPDIEFPARFDADEVGESTLPTALPWDRIRPAAAPASGWLQRIVPGLAERHRERVAGDPDFLREFQRYRALEEMRRRTEVSLVEAERREQLRTDENRLLAIENAWRTAHGEEPAADLDAASNTASEGPVDAFAREAAHLLIDLKAADRVVKR